MTTHLAKLALVQGADVLRQLLRVRSVNPPGDEGSVVDVLETFLSDAGLETEVLVSEDGRSNLVARVDGPPDRSALVLLSHSDVVPVEEERWTRDPFGGEVAEGAIWGRGALDMKGIAVMHAFAAATLARSATDVTREVVVVVAADEEAGGRQGARWLVDEHADRVGFGDGRPPPEVLGEGAYGLSGVLDRPVIPIALGEKTAIWFDVVAEGDPGHGALPPERQAPVNLAAIVRDIAGPGTPRVHAVMREQFATISQAASGINAAVLRALASPANPVVARAVAAQLRKAGPLGFLLSDTVTPTQLVAGYKSNVVPGEARASFDSRLLPDTDVNEVIGSLDQKARRKGGRVENVVDHGHGPVTTRGPLFDIIERASRRLAPDALPTVSLSPAVTDVRFFRARGARGYGWCPVVLSPDLLSTIHGHDERIPLDAFERAVSVMSEVVVEAAT